MQLISGGKAKSDFQHILHMVKFMDELSQTTVNSLMHVQCSTLR